MNINKVEELADLIIKVKLNVATPDQREKLNIWLSDSNSNLKLYSSILSGKFLASKYMMEDELSEIYNIVVIKREIIKKITLKRNKGRIINFSKAISVAAVIALGIFIGTTIFNVIGENNLKKQSLSERERMASKITPYNIGGKAILEKDNGDKIELLAEIDAIIENKTAEFEHAENKFGKGAKIAQNTISTPKGVTYNVTLSDGTKVWLNENSKLKYPVIFLDNLREVTLEGEGYFEVSSNVKAPFHVHSPNSTVKVLGTRFNIKNNNYQSITTLIEGSVEVNSSKTKLIIKPSQQAKVSDNSDAIEVSEVDINIFTAWKDGKYIFKNQTLETIMNSLSEWYNLEIEYDDRNTKNLTLSGVIFKFDTFEDVIEILETTKRIEIKVKDKNKIKIYIKE